MEESLNPRMPGLTMERSLTQTLIAVLLLIGCTPALGGEQAMLSRFEMQLEELRQQLKIPGFSAAIVRDQKLVWAKGFGYAELQNSIETEPDTPFHLASLTKPFAAFIIMQLVEDGSLDLNTPVSEYGVELESPDTITVAHLLSMTSEGVPGRDYNYNGDRFGHLARVIHAVSGKSLAELLFEKILEPLELSNTAPSPAACTGLGERGAVCERVFSRIARPYALGYDLSTAEGFYQESFGPAAGLISTAVDLARFDIAVDQNRLVSAETKERMFAPTVSPEGTELPYGLGWFSQNYRGTRLIWHYGNWPPSVSSLILKVPREQITLVILANTDNLSRPFNLGAGDVLNSPVALAFYKTFVFEPRYERTVPNVDWQADHEDLAKLLSKYSDDDLRDLLTREHASYKMLFSAYSRMERLGQRIAAGRAADVDPSSYNSWVGRYEVPAELSLPVSTIELVTENDQLYLKFMEGVRFQLYPESMNHFFFTTDGADLVEVTFATDTSGKVTHFLTEDEGTEAIFKRIDP